MSGPNGFEDLARKARRVAMLAADPHPERVSWCRAFWKVEKDLRDLLVARAAVPLAPGEVLAPDVVGR